MRELERTHFFLTTDKLPSLPLQKSEYIHSEGLSFPAASLVANGHPSSVKVKLTETKRINAFFFFTGSSNDPTNCVTKVPRLAGSSHSSYFQRLSKITLTLILKLSKYEF